MPFTGARVVEQCGVGRVPVRTFPAGGFEELRAERLLAGVERRGAQRAQRGRGTGVARLHRLQRMEDVVDLDEVLLVLGLDVGRSELVGLEPVQVAGVQVDARVAVDHPLGHRLGHAGRVGDPDRLGGPEAVELGVRAEQREVVGGEREHPVERVGELEPAVGEQAGQHPLRLGQREGEVVRGEVEHRRLAVQAVHLVVVGPRGQVLDPDRDRPVAVGADADGLAVLAEVEVGVLVTQHRADGLGGPAPQRPDRPGPGELMGQRGQGQPLTDQTGDLLAPDARAADDEVGRQLALVGEHPGDPVAGGEDVEDLGPVADRGPALGGPVELGGHRADRLRDAVVGDEQPAEHVRGVEQVEAGDGFGRVEQLGARHPPGLGQPEPAVQLAGPLGSGGDLEAADRQVARVALPAQRGELGHRVAGEVAHHLGPVDLEDHAGRV